MFRGVSLRCGSCAKPALNAATLLISLMLIGPVGPSRCTFTLLINDRDTETGKVLNTEERRVYNQNERSEGGREDRGEVEDL